MAETNGASKTLTLEGVCIFHSETGTEGGFWAFEDARFNTPNTTQYACKRCSTLWDKKRNPSGPRPLSQSSLEDLAGALKELGRSLPSPCSPGEHDFELWPPFFSSYEGLHVLEDGDHLTIYNPKNRDEVVWSGTIALQPYHLFTESAFGWWIHADQRGIDRNAWAKYFFEEYPAKLLPTPKKAEERIE
ncbi:hypothetical protein HYS49_02720 [Candidatus Woesearchaeota archaeon]|nr:hypothetical protein [Candidatus Woesearchaeota archaeon]